MVAAAAVSQIGQFEAEMSSDSFQLLGMAERGFLPAALAKRSKHDTPTIGIILSSLGVLILVEFNFTQVSSSSIKRSQVVQSQLFKRNLIIKQLVV